MELFTFVLTTVCIIIIIFGLARICTGYDVMAGLMMVIISIIIIYYLQDEPALETDDEVVIEQTIPDRVNYKVDDPIKEDTTIIEEVPVEVTIISDVELTDNELDDIIQNIMERNEVK